MAFGSVISEENGQELQAFVVKYERTDTNVGNTFIRMINLKHIINK